MTEPMQPSTAPSHDAHDRTVVAELAARRPDLTPMALDAARAQVAACSACTDLLADLMALQAAVPTASVPARPRSFTLSPDDAARLRPRTWRRMLGFIGSARDGFTRPLAMGLTTLGIAGLVVASVPALGGLSGATGGAAAGPKLESVVGSDRAAPAAAPGASDLNLLSGEPDLARASDGAVFQGGSEGAGPTGERTTDIASEPDEAAIRDDRTGLSTLIVLAGSLVIMGLGLFGLRWSARRFGSG
jgi:hypothetical protein